MGRASRDGQEAQYHLVLDDADSANCACSAAATAWHPAKCWLSEAVRWAQVGRAGRDGQEAQCHLFLDDADFRRLRSLNSSDSVGSSSVLAFLEAAFEAAEEATPQADGGHENAAQAGLGVALLPAQELSRSLDLKVEVMETLLSYLEVCYALSPKELHPAKVI